MAANFLGSERPAFVADLAKGRDGERFLDGEFFGQVAVTSAQMAEKFVETARAFTSPTTCEQAISCERMIASRLVILQEPLMN